MTIKRGHFDIISAIKSRCDLDASTEKRDHSEITTTQGPRRETEKVRHSATLSDALGCTSEARERSARMHVLDGRGAHAAAVGEVEEHGVELEAGEGARAARAREAHPIGLRLVARALHIERRRQQRLSDAEHQLKEWDVVDRVRRLGPVDLGWATGTRRHAPPAAELVANELLVPECVPERRAGERPARSYRRLRPFCIDQESDEG